MADVYAGHTDCFEALLMARLAWMQYLQLQIFAVSRDIAVSRDTFGVVHGRIEGSFSSVIW